MTTKHEWLDFKASAENHKGPGKMWTYYRCKGCGKIVEEKTDDECSSVLRYRQGPTP
jgi:rRNA maturation endonuclease Nob1